MNAAIRAAAWQAARGEISVPKQSGLCLQLVRLIVERALFEGRYEFYDRYLVERTTQGREGRSDWTPWASDLEASMKKLGYAVPLGERQPGDLIFNHQAAAPIGHVAVLIDRDTVLENINPAYRPKSVHLGRYLSLTPLEHFRRTLLARLRPR